MDGVLIDPPARRIRYFVVRTANPLAGRCLLPAETPLRIEPDSHVARVDGTREDLAFEPFDPASVGAYDEEAALTAMFGPRAA